MVRICFRDRRWIILLALLVTSASTIPSEKDAYVTAKALSDRGNWVAAEPLLRDALARFGHEDVDAVWKMRILFAQALTGQGKYEEAETVLGSKLPQRLARSEIAVDWWLMHGVVAFRLQHEDDCKRDFDLAERIVRSHHPRLESDVLYHHAVLEFSRQHYALSERYALRAVLLAQRNKQPRVEGQACGTLGRLRTLQQRYDEAIDYDRRGLAIAKLLGDESMTEKITGNLGWVYTSLGDFEAASELFIDAFNRAKKIDAEYDAAAWINQLGDMARIRRDYTSALEYYGRGIPLAKSVGRPDVGEFLGNLAIAQLETGDLSGARATNAEALALDREKRDEDQELRSLLIDARIDAASGALDSAIGKCRHVVEAAKTKSRRWEAEARLAQFYDAAHRPGDADENFRFAIDTASDARQDILTEELRLPFGALVREVYNDYVAFLVRSGRGPDALDVAELSRGQTLEEALHVNPATRRPDPKRVARERGAIVLSFWLAPGRSYVWTITKDSIDVKELPPAATIEREIEAYSRELLDPRGGSDPIRKRGAALYAMLVAPVAKLIPLGSRVIIIPDGRLHEFNMETLVVPATRLKYWIEDVTIMTASSLDLLDGNGRHPRSQRDSILLVGNPASADRDYPPLPNASAEVNRVARHFKQYTMLSGAGATPGAYKRAGAGDYAYIHFVAHGIATRQRPLDSAVVLAREGDAYKLYARDIVKQPLQARLVTISSCHGAGVRTYAGEGLVGLAWAFLHAGAQQVIAALWEVNDNTTPMLMDRMYDGIRANHDPATALRDAKLSFIRSDKVHRYPRYWAPFVLYSGS